MMDKKNKKKRGIFWLPIKRLIDLMACLGYYSQHQEFPDKIPKLAYIISRTSETEGNLVNWRDGTKRFLEKHFEILWQKLCPEEGLFYPLFVVATIWQNHSTSRSNRTTILIKDHYQWWWDLHYKELAK